MRKAGRVRTVILVGLVLLLGAGLLIQGVGTLLAGLTPDTRSAAGVQPNQPSACTDTQHGPIIGRSLEIDEQEVACGDLTLIGSTLDVKGQIQGTILAFGSNIQIAGNVSGNVNLYGGDVTLQNGSQLRGNINLFGGSEHRKAGAILVGKVNDRSQHISFWLPGLSTGFVFPFWSIIIWVVLGLLLTSLLPEHLMFVRATIMHRAKRSLLLGFLSLMLAPVVLIVLIALIILIPLAILIASGLIAAWALGTIATGWLVGEYVMRAIRPGHNKRLIQVAVGLTLVVLIGSLPYIGWLFSLGAGSLGLGAVFLSRFGTRLYGQPRQLLTS